MSVASRGRVIIGGSVLVWAVLVGMSLAHTLDSYRRQADQLALERARMLFELIETARLWNAGHGGVYVKVDEKTPPNEYLDIPDRDVLINGIPYTKVNPAYMTRQIAELYGGRDDTVFHITSLKPIRPANAADDWERKALRQFESRRHDEVIELTTFNGRPAYRYMAALVVEKPCLLCHEKQGYKLGDIRGGISVTIPAARVLADQDRIRMRTIVQHLLVFLILSVLSTVFVWRLERDYRAVAKAKAEQEAMVAERTAALSAANAELERSNRDLEQFAYITSHDLQEPLRMMGSYAQLVERRYKDVLDDEGREFLGYISRGSQRMKAMVDGLLAYSRVQRGELKRERVRVGAVLDAALANLARAVRETGAEVSRGELPEVEADPALLTNLFQNLIGNAVKYRHPDRPPRIHVSANREGREWVFRVTDNGIGIDPAQSERIFQIFQRLHGPEAYPGTGIGLAVCRKIVERHGGRIWVESDGGVGATFAFSLPAT